MVWTGLSLFSINRKPVQAKSWNPFQTAKIPQIETNLTHKMIQSHGLILHFPVTH